MSLSQVLYHLKEGADQVIETSCAVVILKGTKAYKVKKSVDYGFLDFTSPEKRRSALLRELRYNQRMAADIYLGVEEIAGESVLVMRRFDNSGVLGEQSSNDPAWTPDLDLMHNLGRMVGRFHAGSEICRDPQHDNNVKYVIDSNQRNIEVFRTQLGAGAVDAYNAAIYAAYEAVEPDVLKRFADGHVRHCHGDLHLGNILVENGLPVLFDCIEFNERLSQIDVLYDLGFLLMDLWVRGHGDAASRVLNVYLEQAARLEDDVHSVYAGLKLLPLYLSVRAGVRCHVNANYGGEGNYAMDKARIYLEAAHRFLEIAPPTFTAVGGLSGSGKSTKSRQIAPASGRPPGAVILRSDEIRKRLWACPEYEALPHEAYTPDETDRVYGEMFTLAQTVAATGQSLILDATFREAAWRDKAQALADQAHVPFRGVWLDVPAADRAARVAQRTKDVSDATPQIAERQQTVDLATLSWHIEP
ncbi:bifunctional aminoglycoside phosphotransferase/ATP-binding protein [Asticcacaulis sp. AC402]|uniref:bifunctional aminoglycoside phosphotransferase/ATP-binding protein n=1 Tax=Asticcacaulis sp. AC402 TaxID=1282361 RepID=UPI0003C3B2F4|nr:bifunctional aminoglycoside phosphotransferase/ATP-binding protein [Asticcacaulis sp. AC402]ESQ74448.1 aminoglycoside phosphotransferase [Asticcacaulis sp. AC402]